MEQDNNLTPEKKEETEPDKTHWIDKAEAFIDEAADKIHQSEAYRKAGKAAERAALKIFRQAGKWWGKSQR